MFRRENMHLGQDEELIRAKSGVRPRPSMNRLQVSVVGKPLRPLMQSRRAFSVSAGLGRIAHPSRRRRVLYMFVRLGAHDASHDLFVSIFITDHGIAANLYVRQSDGPILVPSVEALHVVTLRSHLGHPSLPSARVDPDPAARRHPFGAFKDLPNARLLHPLPKAPRSSSLHLKTLRPPAPATNPRPLISPLVVSTPRLNPLRPPAPTTNPRPLSRPLPGSMPHLDTFRLPVSMQAIDDINNSEAPSAIADNELDPFGFFAALHVATSPRL